MFVRILGHETVQHVCKGKKAGNMKIGIYKHDLRSYILNGKEFIDINYCPLCGVNLDTDTLDNTIVIKE